MFERLAKLSRPRQAALVAGVLIAVFLLGSLSDGYRVRTPFERQVTPTAAASYFRLLAFLLNQEQLEDADVDNLDDFEGAKDTGTFIRFHSSDVRTPVYANPYLVVRQSGTLKALFPTAGADEFERDSRRGRRGDPADRDLQVSGIRSPSPSVGQACRR